MNIALQEVLLRLGAAVLAGGVLGLNRNLSGKSAGLRTNALVCLGAALVTLVALEIAGADGSGALRVVQGVITGIGFLGGGVILHPQTRKKVSGLTTAATIWVAASLGIACGAGLWPVLLCGLLLTLLVLLVGGPFEQLSIALAAHWRGRPPVEPDASPPALPANGRASP
ncbi:MgtC/SapB family protein [Gloeobacter violaceus]|uniref:MgtC/SapB family protein n=1 Tax=Gloeobacter violaceus TaxID=33072 RepID=UPI0002FD62D3|nr:MgtC/SapB family protein [Gloeobacter violaceus]